MATRKPKKREDLPFIELTDMTPAVFEAVLKFIYYYDTTFTTAVACQLLRVCKRFELYMLQSYCEEYLENSPVTQETVFALYGLHSWYNGTFYQQQFADRMRIKSINFMVKHFTSLDLRQVLQLRPQDAMEVLQIIQKINHNNNPAISRSDTYKALKEVSESENSVPGKLKLKRWQFKHIDSDISEVESVSGRSESSIPISVSQNGPEIVYPSNHPFQRKFDSVTRHSVMLPQDVRKKDKQKPVSVMDLDFRQNGTAQNTEPVPDSRDSINIQIPQDSTQIPEDDLRIPESTTSSEPSASLHETTSRVVPSTFFVHKPVVRIESRYAHHNFGIEY